MAYPFNIYLQPYNSDKQYDKLFIFSSGAAAFLASHNFDFNKCFYEGVSYLSHEDEMLLKETNRLEALKMELRRKDQEVTHDMAAFYDSNKEQIRQFFHSEECALHIPIKFLKYKVYNHLVTQVLPLPPTPRPPKRTRTPTSSTSSTTTTSPSAGTPSPSAKEARPSRNLTTTRTSTTSDSGPSSTTSSAPESPSSSTTASSTSST